MRDIGSVVDVAQWRHGEEEEETGQKRKEEKIETGVMAVVIIVTERERWSRELKFRRVVFILV